LTHQPRVMFSSKVRSARPTLMPVD